jgi:hypothetical protein
LCDVSCNGCSEKPKKCSQCNLNYYQKEPLITGEENYCYKVQDETKYYLDSTISKLKLCDVSCNGCSEKPKKCSQCNLNYYQKDPFIIGEENYCYKVQDETKYYLDLTTSKLKKCDISCKECQTSPKYCLTCEENYKRKSFVDPKLECFNDSIKEQGYYLDRNGRWSLCHESCINCDNEEKNCKKCNEDKGYFKFDYKEYGLPMENQILNELPFTKYSAFENICIKKEQIIKGLFFDEKLKKFVKCNEKCSECENEFSCLTCNTEKDYFPNFNNSKGKFILLIINLFS